VIRPGSIILVHLVNPTEKFWGVLYDLGVAGVQMRGISVASFGEWMLQAASKEPPSLGLSTMFVPLFRIERLYLDEPVGAVASYQQSFAERVGMPVERYLKLHGGLDVHPEADAHEMPS
jgi:hypothetical protein